MTDARPTGAAIPDFESLFAALPARYMVLDRNLTIVAASDAYLEATRTGRDEIVGRFVFDVFPDNPDDPGADAVAKSTASFRRVLAGGVADAMPVQRHDVRVSGLGSDRPRVAETYWKPVNRPVFDVDGEVGWVLHAVEDVTEIMRGRRAAPASPAPESERRRIIEELRWCNSMLASLPDHLFAHLADHLAPVEIPVGTVLAGALGPLKAVYFPLEGMNATVVNLADGSSVEAAIGGAGGMVGVSMLTGAEVEETETRALIAGSALRIGAGAFRDLLAVHPELRPGLAWFVPSLIAQMSLTLACNARHSINQRMARWLLTATSRIGGPVVPVTQETIALALGIRRSGASESLRRLAAHGLVETGRRQITILDARHLQIHACSCFAESEAVRARYAMPVPATARPGPARIFALIHRHHRLSLRSGGADR